MSINRYARASNIKLNQARGQSNASAAIYWAIQRDAIKFEKRIIKQGERLDIIAGILYKDSSLWWVIAAASGIGWSLQVPPGTVLNVPLDLSEIELLVG
jgi:nucleoid-associated protein YgaU